jgi:hypothetical protein
MDTDALIDALGEEFLAGIPQPSRPMAPFLWVGGKGNLARWILRYLPKGHIYVEPFAGAVVPTHVGMARPGPSRSGRESS